MKAVIHIGTPKSGTTTIQSFLTLNRAALLARGFRFEAYESRYVAQMELGLVGMVLAGETVDAPNKRWALGVDGAESQRAFVERFDATLRANRQIWTEHTYIGSSEQISAWLSNPRRVQAFHDFMLSHFEDVRYIVYFRPQTELMLSSYSERIKRGEILTFDEHFKDRLAKMNWNRRARLWTDVVGKDRLSVRLLDRGVMRNGDLLDDYCDAAGIDRTGLETPPRMNVSLSIEEIALYLRLRRYLPNRTRRGAPNLVFYGLLRLLQKRLPKPGTRLKLTEAQTEAIRAQYLDSNDRLRAEFFPERTTLFSNA